MYHIPVCIARGNSDIVALREYIASNLRFRCTAGRGVLKKFVLKVIINVHGLQFQNRAVYLLFVFPNADGVIVIKSVQHGLLVFYQRGCKRQK
jgi:hypothetical protein